MGSTCGGWSRRWVFCRSVRSGRWPTHGPPTSVVDAHGPAASECHLTPRHYPSRHHRGNLLRGWGSLRMASCGLCSSRKHHGGTARRMDIEENSARTFAMELYRLRSAFRRHVVYHRTQSRCSLLALRPDCCAVDCPRTVYGYCHWALWNWWRGHRDPRPHVVPRSK